MKGHDQLYETCARARAHKRLERVLVTLFASLAAYSVLAYLVLPAFWSSYEHKKGLATLPMVTRTAQGIPGDPINVALIGDRRELLCAMNAAGWLPADPITFRSSIKIAGSVLLDRAYKGAPVSSLYYLGRHEDYAFEKLAGTSAGRRHHVRVWQLTDEGPAGRPYWLGAVTYDKGVGVSHFTGAITHHIDADIDAERDLLAADLEKAGTVSAEEEVRAAGAALTGKNGGGDRYHTDGRIRALSLTPACRKTAEVAAGAPPAGRADRQAATTRAS